MAGKTNIEWCDESWNPIVVCSPVTPYGYDALRGRTAPFMSNQPEFYWSSKDPRLDGVIVGGESGPGARPMHPDSARAIRDQCATAGVPFFFKQWGEFVEFGATPEIEVIHDDGSERADAILALCHRPSWITRDGRHIVDRNDLPEYGQQRARLIDRVGKRAAGRLLDGREHNDLPWRLAK